MKLRTLLICGTDKILSNLFPELASIKKMDILLPASEKIIWNLLLNQPNNPIKLHTFKYVLSIEINMGIGRSKSNCQN